MHAINAGYGGSTKLERPIQGIPMTSRRDLLTFATAAASRPLLPDDAQGASRYTDAESAIWRHAGTPPANEEALLHELVRCATLAANSHNTQPWRFALAPARIDIVPDLARRTPVVDPDDHHLWISLGCAVENLVLAAAAFGRHAQVDLDGDATRVRVALAPMAPARSLLFDAIPQRQCTRGLYDGAALSATDLRALETAAARPGVRLRLLTARSELDTVLDFVRRGLDVQVRDPAFAAELKQWIRFSERDALATRDGLFARCSGNPSAPAWLGRLLFDLFFTPRLEQNKAHRLLRSSAAVAVFAAEDAGPPHWLEVGRACQRLMLMATPLAIRAAFINPPVEVPALRAPFARAVGLGATRPDLALRLGRGPLMPRSLRRPLAAVLA